MTSLTADITKPHDTSSSKFYDDIGIKYQDAYSHCSDHIEFIKELLALIPPYASVLDLGCGTGKPTSSMIADSGRHVLGIDFSSEMISISRRQVSNAIFDQIDILQYSPKSTFDAVVAMYSLLNFTHEQMKDIVTKIGAWVKPGGHFFLGTLDPDAYEASTSSCSKENAEGIRSVYNLFMGNRANILLYTPEGWKRMLEDAGFEILTEKKAVFAPPLESGSGTKYHYYIAAKRVDV